MKAAIITLHTVCNYGTVLQTYATQEKLKEYFEEVCFIDYRRPDTYGIGLLKTFTEGNVLKILPILPTLIYWKYIFGGFIKKYIKTTDCTYLDEASFEKFDDCADIYFSGSDQVWNTGWNGGVLAPFYLSFVPENKPRYAYASSFGMDKLSDQDVEKSSQYIKKFKKITVREKSGINILKKQYGYDNVAQILDPTLAMSADFWRKVAPEPKIYGDYILIYNLNRSKAFDEYANELAKRTGYKLYRFCTRLDQIFRSGKSLVMPKVFEFISLIDNAKFVLTDSFHATAFSMNMNTHPICIYPDNYSGRISEFLELVEAVGCHVKNYSDFDVVNRHVNFKRVNEILRSERGKTDCYLKEIVSETKLIMERKKL